MAGTVRGAADSTRARLRDASRAMAAKHSAEGRAYHGLDRTLYETYVVECFLRALAASPARNRFVLRGGNLFRIWDSMDSFRPTSDVDLQCRDPEDTGRAADIRAEMAAIVCTREFEEATGLVFQLEAFEVRPVFEGFLVAWSLSGKALLGEPGQRPSEIPFRLEVNYGPPPDGAIAVSRWEPIMPKDEAFSILSSRPEWTAADKFHAIVTRGETNARAKDFRDLAVLLGTAEFDDQLLHKCITEVFGRRGQEHLLPERAGSTATLSPAYASPQNEYLWRKIRWPEWEGREWLAGRDPTLAETVSRLVFLLERKGVLPESPETAVATALAEAWTASASMSAPDASTRIPLAAARLAAALKAFVPGAAAIPRDQLAWRWLAPARELGAPSDPAEALSTILADADRMGLSAALDRGWDRGRGGGAAALRGILAGLVPPAAPPLAEPDFPEPREMRDRVAKAPRRARPSARTPQDTMADGCRMLASAQNGTSAWFGGLAKVLSVAEVAAPAATLAVTMPDDPRAPYIWMTIAGRQGVETDLHAAVARVQELLGGERPAPAGPGR